jgi:penicillin-binding protein 2
MRLKREAISKMVQTSLKGRMLEAFRFRMYFFITVVSLIFLALIIQLINLQIIHGSEYREKSRSNMEDFIPIPATRGEIYDRTFSGNRPGMSVVTNRPSFNITTIPARFKSSEEMKGVIENLRTLLRIPEESIKLDLRERNPWERIVIIEDVNFESIVRVASNQHLIPNIDWEDAPVRVYNANNIFAHVVGYIGSISKEEYGRLRRSGYKYYQKIGKTGIEKKYDSLLRGKDGFIKRIVDVKNRTEGEQVGLEPVSGSNIILTLDYEVQKATHDAMGDKKGSAVAIKVSTGEVLALVSKPDFDPNQMISKDNSVVVKKLLNDRDRPFLNRVIQAKYPPASTFKLVTAIAALETEKSHPGKTFFCPGKFTLRGYRDKDFYCFQAHGALDLKQAIAHSCSVYFYKLGYKIGPTPIITYAGYLGLNQKTGIDIPGEERSFVPSMKWKLRTYGQSWFDGDTINMSIGQGFLNITPIGMANLVASIVNNGIAYKPKVIREIRSADNSRIVRGFKKERLRETPLSPLTIKTIKTGMRMGVLIGTQKMLKNMKVQVAGKTGTAQTRSIRKEDATQHAWYVGYAPFDAPVEKAVAVAVLVEYGQWGAMSALPVAGKMISKMEELGYFK